MPDIQLQVPTPYVTYEEFARITGLPYNTVKRMVYDGRLPVREKNNPKEKPMINLVALHKEAGSKPVADPLSAHQHTA
ncbi:DNA-binding protein [Shewanella dokdonensis]|uniref:DNA-binding protein n=1 Tax=Shewanella dokdonensis TaxID=712036 RepID=A0ABX8DJX6_9GAMM|nr:DNA-binding protein [Shewanella dokdonensis]